MSLQLTLQQCDDIPEKSAALAGEAGLLAPVIRSSLPAPSPLPAVVFAVIAWPHGVDGHQLLTLAGSCSICVIEL